MTRRFAPEKEPAHTLRQVIDTQVCTYLRALRKVFARRTSFYS
jgi:hypothetical protein